MIVRAEDKFIIKCDRCLSKIDEFKNERSYELLSSSPVQLCSECQKGFTEKHLAAIRMRIKNGVIYSSLNSGDDKDVELELKK